MNMNMENFNDVIFEDDEFDDIENVDQNLVDTNLEPTEPQEEEDITSEVLRLKGITDPQKIKFEDESGAIVERSWDSLSREELINILASQETLQSELNSSEAQLINLIRESGMSVNDYLLSIAPEPTTPQKSYHVDELSDDEVYALDLIHKVGDDITDEEITQAIEVAKQNDTLFKKTVEGLRKEYVRLQEDEEALIANEQAAREEAIYNNFANSINNQIKELNSFAGQSLELSEDDIEELSSFMLLLDNNGLSAFGRAMNDPALFTKAAFWILNEDKIVEELNKLIQDNYRRGYEQAKSDLLGKPKSKLVFKTPTSQKKTTDDVFIDDEDWY